MNIPLLASLIEYAFRLVLLVSVVLILALVIAGIKNLLYRVNLQMRVDRAAEERYNRELAEERREAEIEDRVRQELEDQDED